MPGSSSLDVILSVLGKPKFHKAAEVNTYGQNNELLPFNSFPTSSNVADFTALFCIYDMVALVISGLVS